MGNPEDQDGGQAWAEGCGPVWLRRALGSQHKPASLYQQSKCPGMVCFRRKQTDILREGVLNPPTQGHSLLLLNVSGRYQLLPEPLPFLFYPIKREELHPLYKLISRPNPTFSGAWSRITGIPEQGSPLGVLDLRPGREFLEVGFRSGGNQTGRTGKEPPSPLAQTPVCFLRPE